MDMGVVGPCLSRRLPWRTKKGILSCSLVVAGSAKMTPTLQLLESLSLVNQSPRNLKVNTTADNYNSHQMVLYLTGNGSSKMEREKRTENSWKRDGVGAWVGQGKRRPVLLYFPSLYRSGRKFIVLTFCESFSRFGKKYVVNSWKMFLFCNGDFVKHDSCSWLAGIYRHRDLSWLQDATVLR